MDWLSIICWAFLGFCGGIILVAVLTTFSERRKYRRQVSERLESVLMQEPQRVKWTCRRCNSRHYGLLPMGPVCRDCWLALDAYLSEVA